MSASTPDWLARLLSVLMAEPHATVAQLAERLGVRASILRHEIDVFYHTELHQLPPQWWGVMTRLARAPAPAPPPPVADVAPLVPVLRACACGAPLHHGRQQRCPSCAAARRKAQQVERYQRATASGLCTRCHSAETGGRTMCQPCMDAMVAARKQRAAGITTDTARRHERTTSTIDAIFNREYARARREMHVTPWEQRLA